MESLQTAFSMQGPFPGFCKSARTEEVAKHSYVLTPGRTVGAEDAEDDGVPFEERIAGLKESLAEQFDRSDALSRSIQNNLAAIE